VAWRAKDRVGGGRPTQPGRRGLAYQLFVSAFDTGQAFFVLVAEQHGRA
jgi:hypothetical protein